VPLEKLNGHDGKNWQALASELMQHLGIKLHTMGAVDPKPYDRVQVQPGEVIMQVLERYARMRNIVVGSNANGGLLAIGEHEVQPTGDLAEGYNILRANAVVRDNMVYKRYLAVGQGAGSDAKHGDEQNKQIAQRWGTSTRNRYSIVVADLADDLYGLERRVKMEEVFSEGSNIEASITVQGWFKNNNTSEEIWRAGEYYTIFSPSLILNDTVLGCAGCVYEQTNGGGTTTTMQMVKPIHMNGQYNYRNEAQEYARRVRERRPPPTTPEVKTK
jgi:prophage tail gpP-like protein